MKFKQIFLSMLVLTVLAFNVDAQCGVGAEDKAAFEALTPKQKAHVWVGHLATAYRTEKDLTPGQKKFIGKAAMLLTEERYASIAADKNADRSDFDALIPEMNALFNKEQILRIFMQLSPIEARGNLIVPVAYTPLKVPGVNFSACTCYVETIGVCSTCRHRIQVGGAICSELSFGCGPFFVFQCNGLGCGGVTCPQGDCPPEV